MFSVFLIEYKKGVNARGTLSPYDMIAADTKAGGKGKKDEGASSKPAGATVKNGTEIICKKISFF